jgi:hypothetical protein
MKRHTLICGHCDRSAGWAVAGPPHRAWIRGHNGEPGAARVWNNDPVFNPDTGPDSWPWTIGHCHRCGWELALGPPPWPRRVIVPVTGRHVEP